MILPSISHSGDAGMGLPHSSPFTGAQPAAPPNPWGVHGVSLGRPRSWGQADVAGEEACAANSLAFHPSHGNMHRDHSINAAFVISSADFIPNIYPNGRN